MFSTRFESNSKSYPFIFEGEGGGGAEDDPNIVKVKVEKDDKGRPIFLGPDGKRLFTQEHMDREIGSARAKAGEQNKQLIAQLEEMQKKANLSEQTKAEIEDQLNQLRQANMTEAEKAKEQVKQWEQKHKSDTEKLTKRLQEVTTAFEEKMISTDILAACNTHEVISYELMYPLLRSRAKLQDVMVEGKPTGEKEVKISFDDKDEDGKPITLVLSVDEAVTRMKTKPERFGSLFLHKQEGGTGHSTMYDQGSSGNGGSGKPDFSKMSLEQYEEWEKKNLPASNL